MIAIHGPDPTRAKFVVDGIVLEQANKVKYLSYMYLTLQTMIWLRTWTSSAICVGPSEEL